MHATRWGRGHACHTVGMQYSAQASRARDESTVAKEEAERAIQVGCGGEGMMTWGGWDMTEGPRHTMVYDAAHGTDASPYRA